MNDQSRFNLLIFSLTPPAAMQIIGTKESVFVWDNTAANMADGVQTLYTVFYDGNRKRQKQVAIICSKSVAGWLPNALVLKSFLYPYFGQKKRDL